MEKGTDPIDVDLRKVICSRRKTLQDVTKKVERYGENNEKFVIHQNSLRQTPVYFPFTGNKGGTKYDDTAVQKSFYGDGYGLPHKYIEDFSPLPQEKR